MGARTVPLNLGLGKPTKVPAEMFSCDADPGAWAANADDVEVAINETRRTYGGQNCRVQMANLCKLFKANDLVVGECQSVQARRPTSSELQPEN